SGAWWLQRQRAERVAEAERRQQQTDASVEGALGQVRLLYGQARDTFPPDPKRYEEALKAAHGAEDLAGEGPASAELRRRATALRQEIEGEREAAARDRRLLAAVLEVRSPRETPTFVRDRSGMVTRLAGPTADEQFASAFRAWGLDIDRVAVAEAAAR